MEKPRGFYSDVNKLYFSCVKRFLNVTNQYINLIFFVKNICSDFLYFHWERYWKLWCFLNSIIPLLHEKGRKFWNYEIFNFLPTFFLRYIRYKKGRNIDKFTTFLIWTFCFLKIEEAYAKFDLSWSRFRKQSFLGQYLLLNSY